MLTLSPLVPKVFPLSLSLSLTDSIFYPHTSHPPTNTNILNNKDFPKEFTFQYSPRQEIRKPNKPSFSNSLSLSLSLNSYFVIFHVPNSFQKQKTHLTYALSSIHQLIIFKSGCLIVLFSLNLCKVKIFHFHFLSFLSFSPKGFPPLTISKVKETLVAAETGLC